MLQTEFSVITLSLIAACAIVAGVVLALLLPRLRRVRRAVMQDAELGELPEGLAFPAASVIVHAQCDASSLDTLLPMILEQDYPAPFEVIVVNDGGDEAVSDVVARHEMHYRNLYMTFAPARSRNLSRKKLAITLGVKAARYDAVAILAGNCRLLSDGWLRLMMRPIATGRDITVGYGCMVPSESADKGRHRLVAFDTVRTAVQYLSAALCGRLYRAFGNNIAYRRQLFFDNKGFSGSLNLRYGDDDIFVSSIARRGNYSVELSPYAMVEVVEDNPVRMHRLDKLRHDFTAKFVSGRSRIMWGFISLLWWAWTALSVAAIVSGLPSLVPLIAVTVVSLGLCLPVMLAWRSTSKALRSRKLLLTVPLMMWLYPLYSAVYRIMGRRQRNANYTWSSLH